MKQPKALYVLNFVSMWEYFSYYGMRGLLVLFMTQELGFSDSRAFGLYALYTTFGELGCVAGGVIADRFLGFKCAIMLGGWIIALGHISLAVPGSIDYFYVGLGLITLGTAFFRSNVAALLGTFYEKDDPRRESGYTIYYAGINIGGFLAAIVCAFAAERYGWHVGFGLAAIGMLIGNSALLFGQKLLFESKPKMQQSGYVLPDKKIWMALAPFILLLVIYYGCEEQLGSSLVLFSERHVERESFFGTFPAASLIMCNPLTILLVGPLISRLQLGNRRKIQLSFLLLGFAFLLLYSSTFQEIVPLWFPVSSIVLIAMGELFIGPTVYAAASKASSDSSRGLVMGVVTLGFSLANLVSGFLSQMMVVTDAATSRAVYANGFAFLGALALVVALALSFQYKNKIGCHLGFKL